MKFDFDPPKSIESLKKRARSVRKTHGIKLSEAHEALARYCGYGSFHEALIKMNKI